MRAATGPGYENGFTVNLIIAAITCVASFCGAVSSTVATKGMKGDVQLEEADVRTTTTLRYDRFKIDEALSYLDKCITAYTNFFEYLRILYLDTSTCEDALTYKSSTQGDSPFVALIMHLKRHGDLAHQQENVMKVLGLWGSDMEWVGQSMMSWIEVKVVICYCGIYRIGRYLRLSVCAAVQV